MSAAARRPARGRDDRSAVLFAAPNEPGKPLDIELEERLHHDRRVGEILRPVARIPETHAHHPGRSCGGHSRHRVLDRDTGRRRYPECIRGSQVDLRVRFRTGYLIAADSVRDELAYPQPIEHAVDRGGGSRRGNRNRNPATVQILDQGEYARNRRGPLAGINGLPVERGGARKQLVDGGRQSEPLAQLGPHLRRTLTDAPFELHLLDVDPELATDERVDADVERLRVDDHTVHVQNQRPGRRSDAVIARFALRHARIEPESPGAVKAVSRYTLSMRTAAFFDIDGTLYRESLMIEHFKKLLKYEVLDEALWHTEIKESYENWQKRRGNYDDYMLGLAEVYVRSMRGLQKAKMEFITNQVVDLKGDNVYMYTRNRIEGHKAAGHAVIFISGSPDYLVRKMAERYGITDCIGTRYLLDKNDRYTGEIEQMWDSDSKRDAIAGFVRAYDIDLAASCAYGDTMGDRSMFELVGNPVAFNPTRELLTHLNNDQSLRDKVRIAVERKDVVYLLKPGVETFRAYGPES